MSDVRVSVAPITEHAALNELYLRWGYHGGIADTDVVYVARIGGQPVGIVRRSHELGVLMLRGMHVAPEHQHRRIGTQLLYAFIAGLPRADCYCVPFAHLTRFYSQVGFETVSESQAPGFLRERVAHYRAEGHAVVLMRRGASGDLDHAS